MKEYVEIVHIIYATRHLLHSRSSWYMLWKKAALYCTCLWKKTTLDSIQAYVKVHPKLMVN